MSDDDGEEEIKRVRLPKGEETLGILEQRLGGSRSRVRCLDGNERICRIPGRLKRSLWVRQGDLVLVEPWEFGGDEKGDIVYKYRKVEVNWLKRNGYIDDLEAEDEF
jgi:translation initiation factor 1A